MQRGQAPDALLDTYAREREAAADENIRHSTRATDFITPKSAASRLFRDAVLSLARTQPFARTLVNSGRLSTPTTLHGSPLNTPDSQPFAGAMVPGAAAADAPVTCADGRDGWLLKQLGSGFTALVGADGTLARTLQGLTVRGFALAVIAIASAGTRTVDALVDRDDAVARRYDLQPGTVVLLRPDAHVCARWRRPTPAQVEAAMRRALALPQGDSPCP